MSPATTCPHCGWPLDADPSSIHGFGHTVEVLIPATICGDDHPMDPARPDSAEARVGRDRPGPAIATAPRNGDAPPTDLHALTASEPPHPDPATDPTGIDFAFLGTGTAPEAPVVMPETGPDAIRDEPRDDSRPGRSLATVLLASYASAATIALAYLLWTRPRAGATVVDTMPPAARLDASRRRPPPPPIADGLTAAIGTPLAVGSLEVTPVSVRVEPIGVHRASGGKREDGGSALVLRLKLHNRSADRSFAPLAPEFLRADDSGDSDTFIETEAGRIGPYPLALASERAIVGQGFAALKPGETAEAIVAGDRDASDGLTPRMTWRVRLRVGDRETAVVGVRFSPEDLR